MVQKANIITDGIHYIAAGVDFLLGTDLSEKIRATTQGNSISD